ncbi:hypothetical protein BKA66DRAFT_608689 [Pyrenochaeta sp. MPI-SDFR-AT-0127]|nr:hypothetical protein BKA66DRAFT_608689 [Pyrenochaeta sp. MPI-SDFR-AT-0127]
MAAIVLQVIALIAGAVPGLVQIFLPPGDVKVDILAEGNSILRIGIGLNSSSTESLGGTVPAIKVFNEEKVQIGEAPGSSSNNVKEGAFTVVPIFHDANHTFQQPTYVELAGGTDAVCIAYLAQTWADNTQLGWLGDIGKLCGAKWYHSNLYVTTKNDKMYKPYCTWIGNPVDSQNPLLTYSGFKIHIPDFGPVGAQNDFAVPKDPSSLCDFPMMEWYKIEQKLQTPPPTSPAPRVQPFPMKSLVLYIVGVFGMVTSVAGAAVKHVSAWTGDEDAQVIFKESIIGSYDSQHSSKELCTSSTSWGPDFVSFEESLFCDMTLKKTWPLCNTETARNCYDWNSHVIVDGRNKKRETRYCKVTEWR